MRSFFLSLLAALVLTSGFLSAVSENSIEIRSSAFFHSSKRFREVYGNVGPSFGLEATKNICGFDTFVNLDYFNKRRCQSECCHTRIEIINGSFGLKYQYNFCFADAYLGVGPSLSRANLWENSCCGNSKRSKVAIGVVFKSGLIYQLCDCYFLDFFADYIYQPIHFSRHIDLGGVKIGLGLGVKF